MKAAKHMGGKAPGFKRGGAMIDAGREADEESEMEDGHKRGGKVKKRAFGGATEGGMAAARHDRPGRKRGGGVGSDKRPLSSAANSKPADGHAGGDEPDAVA